MKTRTAVAGGTVFVAVGIVASLTFVRHRSPAPSALAPPLPPQVAREEVKSPVSPEPLPESSPKAPAETRTPAQSKLPASVTPPEPAIPPARPRGKTKAPPVDPMARVALSFVGADPYAEAYWEDAINDPTVPAEERQDLIEDLNEDGLSNPKQPGQQDLPLIINRIELIETIGGSAMDQVNLDAFGEAYKDLTIMYRRLTGFEWQSGPG